jgi:hypothetical protein
LWQQRICHCFCSLVYIYITATKSRVDWSLWLTISDNLYTCLMSHSFYRTKQFNFVPFFFHNSNNIWWQVQFIKLYIMQFPITFRHRCIRTDQYQHCTQTQSKFYPQWYRPSVTPTSIKILHKHTHVYISTIMLPESRKESTTSWSCSQQYSKLISFHFLHSAIFIP